MGHHPFVVMAADVHIALLFLPNPPSVEMV